MSIDAHDVAKHEKNRGLPDVCRKIKRANEVFRELGVQTTASVTASKLIDDYDKLPAFLTELGFRSCTFSYPLSSLASSYLSFSDSKPGQLQDRGADRGLRADQADETAQRFPGRQPRANR